MPKKRYKYEVIATYQTDSNNGPVLTDELYKEHIKKAICLLADKDPSENVTSNEIKEFYALDPYSRISILAITLSNEIDVNKIEISDRLLKAFGCSKEKSDEFTNTILPELLYEVARCYDEINKNGENLDRILRAFHEIKEKITNPLRFISYGIQIILATYTLSKGIVDDNTISKAIGGSLLVTSSLVHFEPIESIILSINKSLNKKNAEKALSSLYLISYIIREKYGLNEELVLSLVQREMNNEENHIDKAMKKEMPEFDYEELFGFE